MSYNCNVEVTVPSSYYSLFVLQASLPVMGTPSVVSTSSSSTANTGKPRDLGRSSQQDGRSKHDKHHESAQAESQIPEKSTHKNAKPDTQYDETTRLALADIMILPVESEDYPESMGVLLDHLCLDRVSTGRDEIEELLAYMRIRYCSDEEQAKLFSGRVDVAKSGLYAGWYGLRAFALAREIKDWNILVGVKDILRREIARRKPAETTKRKPDVRKQDTSKQQPLRVASEAVLSHKISKSSSDLQQNKLNDALHEENEDKWATQETNPKPPSASKEADEPLDTATRLALAELIIDRRSSPSYWDNIEVVLAGLETINAGQEQLSNLIEDVQARYGQSKAPEDAMINERCAEATAQLRSTWSLRCARTLLETAEDDFTLDCIVKMMQAEQAKRRKKQAIEDQLARDRDEDVSDDSSSEADTDADDDKDDQGAGPPLPEQLTSEHGAGITESTSSHTTATSFLTQWQTAWRGEDYFTRQERWLLCPTLWLWSARAKPSLFGPSGIAAQNVTLTIQDTEYRSVVKKKKHRAGNERSDGSNKSWSMERADSRFQFKPYTEKDSFDSGQLEYQTITATDSYRGLSVEEIRLDYYDRTHALGTIHTNDEVRVTGPNSGQTAESILQPVTVEASSSPREGVAAIHVAGPPEEPSVSNEDSRAEAICHSSEEIAEDNDNMGEKVDIQRSNNNGDSTESSDGEPKVSDCASTMAVRSSPRKSQSAAAAISPKLRVVDGKRIIKTQHGPVVVPERPPPPPTTESRQNMQTSRSQPSQEAKDNSIRRTTEVVGSPLNFSISEAESAADYARRTRANHKYCPYSRCSHCNYDKAVQALRAARNVDDYWSYYAQTGRYQTHDQVRVHDDFHSTRDLYLFHQLCQEVPFDTYQEFVDSSERALALWKCLPGTEQQLWSDRHATLIGNPQDGEVDCDMDMLAADPPEVPSPPWIRQYGDQQGNRSPQSYAQRKEGPEVPSPKTVLTIHTPTFPKGKKSEVFVSEPELHTAICEALRTIDCEKPSLDLQGFVGVEQCYKGIWLVRFKTKKHRNYANGKLILLRDKEVPLRPFQPRRS